MIAIIDYNAGNIASVQNALARLDVESFVSADPKEIIKADRIIFPGVGRAGAAMRNLKKRELDTFIRNVEKPFLGICLGLQLLAEFSEEDNTECLGILSGRVRRFPDSFKVPEIGWNQVAAAGENPLLSGIPADSYFYFVNSYYLEVRNEYSTGLTRYGLPFASVVQQGNFFGTQFHPEKSGPIGEQVLRNFVNLC